MANSQPKVVTRAVRQQAWLRMRAMEVEMIGLDALAASDKIRDGAEASPVVGRLFQRVRQVMEEVDPDFRRKVA